MNYLGLDVGKKRIGVAISESGVIASEYKTIIVSDINQIIRDIINICQKKEIQKIILGLPKNMDGSESEFTKEVRNFVEKMKKQIKIPILFEDERLTSKEAERLLKEQNVDFTKIKKRIDQFSAKLILEQYLEKIAY